MACYHPLKAFRSNIKLTKKGKSEIVFNLKEGGKLYDEIQLPCGQCIGCRIERSRQWSVRCVHEALMFENNCFITLTFNDSNLNRNCSLVKSDFQKFMKRLRKKFKGVEDVITINEEGLEEVTQPIRFFHCGEYGSKLSRPHHHACLFNFDFPDRTLWDVRSGVRLYRSESLERLWSKEIKLEDVRLFPDGTTFCVAGKYYAKLGFATVGDVTVESAAYVARYINKKVLGERSRVHYSRIDYETGEMFPIEPEYITMSRKPGIGFRWFEKFFRDVYPKDFITIKGKKFAPPRYYDSIYDDMDKTSFREIRSRRKARADLCADNNTPRRLHDREVVQLSKCEKLIRGYEDDC